MKVKDLWFTFSNICLSHTRFPFSLLPAASLSVSLSIWLSHCLTGSLSRCLFVLHGQTIKCCRFWLGKLDRQLCAWLSLKMPGARVAISLLQFLDRVALPSRHLALPWYLMVDGFYLLRLHTLSPPPSISHFAPFAHNELTLIGNFDWNCKMLKDGNAKRLFFVSFVGNKINCLIFGLIKDLIDSKETTSFPPAPFPFSLNFLLIFLVSLSVKCFKINHIIYALSS